jgi:branched-chain amino acid transport system substrate-binding protein
MKTFHAAVVVTAFVVVAAGCHTMRFDVSRAKRDAILKMDHNTAFGGFRVDRDGAQIGHKMLVFQWQDGKKVIVWPEEIAPGKPRFPTPPWSQRP